MKTFKQFKEEVGLTAIGGPSGSGGMLSQPPVNLDIKTKNKIATSSTVKVNTLGDMTGGPYFGHGGN